MTTGNLPSPLSEAKPDSLAELFSRDPLELSRQDRDLIVRELRAQRKHFAEEDAKPKPKRQKLLKAPKGSVKLEDLDL